MVRVYTCVECGADVPELRGGGYPICMCCEGPMCGACMTRPGVYGAMNLCTPCEQAVRAQAQVTGQTVAQMNLPQPPIQRTTNWRYK